jgi:hypothetical protein
MKWNNKLSVPNDTSFRFRKSTLIITTKFKGVSGNKLTTVLNEFLSDDDIMSRTLLVPHKENSVLKQFRLLFHPYVRCRKFSEYEVAANSNPLFFKRASYAFISAARSYA